MWHCIRMSEWQRCPLATYTNILIASITYNIESYVLQWNMWNQDVRMAKMPPCDMLALTAWDQRYSTTLPDSIRDFYLARCHQHCHQHCQNFDSNLTNFTISDGFRLTWSYSHLGPAMPVGSINLNRFNRDVDPSVFWWTNFVFASKPFSSYGGFSSPLSLLDES